ncbi:MAG: oligosaccharide flippase family protein, partial [Bacteroidales bacterium]|nr:oligosaccharide flippase family protein [Bacteroidales bacterium]
MSSKVVNAGKAVLIGSFISRGISAISSIVLARLLYADDYGALVLSAIIAGLITQIGNMGYEIYYLQFKGTEIEKRKVLDQVFNLRLVTNLLLFFIQAMAGLCIVIFTKNKMSGGIILLLSFSLLFEAINAPNDTILKSKMEFQKVTISNIIKELFSTFGKIGG